MDNYTNSFSYIKTIEYSADKLFNMKWQNSYDCSFCIEINNSHETKKAIIMHHTNEMNDKKQELKIIVPLSYNLKQGDIISSMIRIDGNKSLFNDIYVIINTPQLDAVSRAKMRLCNNFLRLKTGNNNVVDIHGSFLQGTFRIEDGEFIKLNDNNLTCMVGTYYKDIIKKYFKETKTRFLINNKAWILDTIDDITNINKGYGIYTITLKSDEINPLDDLENGLAYNGENNETPQVYIINGKDKITKGIEEKFTITPNKIGLSFKLDDWTIENKLAEIVSQSNGECIIKGLISNEQVILSVYDGINEVCNKTIGIVR